MNLIATVELLNVVDKFNVAMIIAAHSSLVEFGRDFCRDWCDGKMSQQHIFG